MESAVPSRHDIPRARPVIELNLNVEEAMIEAVDLLRTIRVQLEAMTSTVNERLNRTFTDAGDDVTKIIDNIETMSSNLANSTSLLYQPFLFFMLFLLFFLILLATFFCIVFHIRKEMKSRNRRNKNSDDANLEEAKPLAEGVEPASAKQRKRRFGWWRRFRGRRANGRSSRSPSQSPELQELREKGAGFQASTRQEQKEPVV